MFSEEMVVLRQVCTDNVIRKLLGDPEHNRLYDLQPSYKCKYPVHYDLDLVAKDQCVNPTYQINDCTFVIER